MPAEQVYDDLYENAEFIDVDQLLEQMLDEHMDGDGEGEGAGGDEDGAGDKEGKGPVKMSQAEKDELKQEIKEAILSAAEGVEAGNLPKGVERMIKDMTAPVMDWNELIQSNVTSSFSNDYSFMKPNRRGWHMDAILPGMTPGEEIEADVFIDLSGSIGYEQGSTFLSEVGGMMSQFDGYKLRVHCFDTAVYNTKEYSSDNMEDIEQYEMYGGGGTDFDCIFNHLKEEGRVPKLLIVFTDGYPFGSWGDEDYCDTTWIIHGDPNPNPPFGTFALYEDHKNKARAA
jgi:predicted metal-dependent peptidase